MIMFLLLVNFIYFYFKKKLKLKGVDFKSKSIKVDDESYKMQLWDTCG